MLSVRVAVIDVGSNTIRLLVAAAHGRRVVPVLERRAYVGLGADAYELGWISDEKLRLAARHVKAFAALAREHAASHLGVLVTAPGRRSSNREDFVSAVRQAAGAPVRILSADDEARLAYLGAVAALDEVPQTVAVCDVGGGSTEVVVGTAAAGPVWLRSFEIGSLALTRAMSFGDPPSEADIERATAELRDRLDPFAAPLPRLALATGGTARALRKVVGDKLGADALENALAKLTKRSAVKAAVKFGLPKERTRTLVAGTLILREIQARLPVPLLVSRAGMREGAAMSLLAELHAA
jgi:exopolyphosphatase / guanosine-5'-triphosphate,3'-diphosphate pyrophosphatase